MEHAVDDDLRPTHPEKHRIREAPEQGSTHRAVDELVSLGIAVN
jgi:hypothetical protein